MNGRFHGLVDGLEMRNHEHAVLGKIDQIQLGVYGHGQGAFAAG